MKKKISVIIQARMRSTRLPGKVLMDIAGKSMLWHLIERLKYSQKIDDIVLAIPDTKKNDELENFARENNVKYFRGSEEDVLSRYYGAAKKFKYDVIVRITSDCSLIDPRIVDKVKENKEDFSHFRWTVDEKEFWRVVKSFRNKELFEKVNGEWKLKTDYR